MPARYRPIRTLRRRTVLPARCGSPEANAPIYEDEMELLIADGSAGTLASRKGLLLSSSAAW
ncbi:hypothetical protein GCM10022224_030970 [Nonomuraea antimicrobica]|uniref:Uncharacterized protein n=1 Tax=Nonomuraea antimicrobica TaxID=561173 RepID=A0ABP7BMW3_9ACTN